ncbi:MAG: aldo/keto reductase family oxidoreductase [Henriciella sp.]
MQRVKLSEQLYISRMAYGLWRLAEDDDTSPHHIQRKIEACLAQGITTIDQADIYGAYGCEEIFGTCLTTAPHLRNKIEIVTKCGVVAPQGRFRDKRVKYYDTTREHILTSVENSLRLMKTDYIDLLLIHRPDPFMDAAETGAARDEIVTSGKVRNVGVSNFKPHDWTLLQSNMSTPLATNQIEISITAHDAFTNGDVAFFQERSIIPMAWSPLGGGRLFVGDTSKLTDLLAKLANRFDVGISAIALAWLLSHPANIVPIIGTNKLHRIEKISDAMNVELDRETWFEIYVAALGREVA